MKFLTLIAVLLTFGTPTWSAQRYLTVALVLRVDSAHQTLLLSCENIPGVMDAGIISVSVDDAKVLAALAPGELVDFTLVTGKRPYQAERVRVRNFEDLEQQQLATGRLKIIEDLDLAASTDAVLKIGQQTPRVELIDQVGKPVDVAGFAGQVVLMNFFYTHCPLPDYCFRLSNNLGNVQKRFKARMGRDLILLSVSFDPVHDQPGILADYAHTWKADPNWHFLTGSVADVKRLCKLFGVDFWPNEAELTHSLHTVVLDRGGRLAANLEGNQFTPQQLGDLVQTVLDRK
jgi:protein SCO1